MTKPSGTPQSMAASGHTLVSQTAVDLMACGGNAFDAVVGAAFVSAIAEPTLTSLGGGGFLLARTADGRAQIHDFFTNTPGLGLEDADLEPHFFPVTVSFAGSDQDFNIGLGSVAVPGTLKGLLHVHGELGRLDLGEVLKPAINAAQKGVVLNEHQGHFNHLLRPILSLSRRSRRLFLPQGQLLGPGDRFANPELARYLSGLAGGRGSSFYQQPAAGRIADEMAAMEGLLTAADLTGYQVKTRSPLRGNYRGLTFLSNPAPSFGGNLICLALTELEQELAPLLAGGLNPHSPEYLVAHARVQLAVERRRAQDQGRPICSRGTTHISVIDPDGNSAALTNSNGEGSGYLAPESGIMLNNMMGEDDLHPDGFHAAPPGLRVASMMSPSLLLDKDQVRLVIGSGGSKRIRTAISQVITLIVDCGLRPQEAVDFPRLHWDGEVFQVEPGYSRSALSRLAELGPVNEWSERNVYFGGVHTVAPNLGGGADPRRGGAVCVGG